MYLLQETCGHEQKEHHSRRKSRSPQTSYQRRKQPQDHQTETEQEKKKEGEMLYSGSFRFMTLPSFGSKNFSLCLEYQTMLINRNYNKTILDISFIQIGYLQSRL